MACDQVEICGNCKHYTECKEKMLENSFNGCRLEIECNEDQNEIDTAFHH